MKKRDMRRERWWEGTVRKGGVLYTYSLMILNYIRVGRCVRRVYRVNPTHATAPIVIEQREYNFNESLQKSGASILRTWIKIHTEF